MSDQLDSSARRAAKRAGLLARKSRFRINTADNLCGYMLIDPVRNACVRGSRFELSAEEVIKFCKEKATA